MSAWKYWPINGLLMKPLRRLLGGFFSAVTLFVLASVAVADESGSTDPGKLIDRLQAGGLILYVRHAATDHSQADRDTTDLSNCQQQRNLSDRGREETRTMARVISQFEIPIGRVYTSPYCRTIETAQIAFGRYEVADGLRATFFTNEAVTAELNQFLRMLLAQAPDAGTNTAIVGHTANLDDVTHVWPKPEGVVHVFRPLAGNRFEHLGRITPTDWAELLTTE